MFVGVRISSVEPYRQDPALALSKQEETVTALTLTGLTSAEVSAALGITPMAVKCTLRSVYNKLGVSSRLELVSMANAQQALQLWQCRDSSHAAYLRETGHLERRDRLQRRYAS